MKSALYMVIVARIFYISYWKRHTISLLVEEQAKLRQPAPMSKIALYLNKSAAEFAG